MASQALTSAALEIEHAPTGRKIQFFQIKMTGFSDTVTPSWTEEAVYGRMDPIVTYQGTTRAIELSFDIGPFPESDDRKKLALQKVSRLMQFQYPTYATKDSATAISRPPLLKVSFANYIRAGSGADTSLLCYMAGMSYNPVDGMSATTTPKVVDDDDGYAFSQSSSRDGTRMERYRRQMGRWQILGPLCYQRRTYTRNRS